MFCFLNRGFINDLMDALKGFIVLVYTASFLGLHRQEGVLIGALKGSMARVSSSLKWFEFGICRVLRGIL